MENGLDKERNIVNPKRKNRKNRKSCIDTDKEGNIVIPKRLKPKNKKRQIKKPKVFILDMN